MNSKKPENSEKRELITWDHPLISQGICPEYLIRPLLPPFEDSYWPKWCKKHKFLFKTMKGERWFSLIAFQEYLGSSHPDEDDDFLNSED